MGNNSLKVVSCVLVTSAPSTLQWWQGWFSVETVGRFLIGTNSKMSWRRHGECKQQSGIWWCWCDDAYGGRWVIDGVQPKRRSEWYRPMMKAMETVFSIVSDRKRGNRWQAEERWSATKRFYLSPTRWRPLMTILFESQLYHLKGTCSGRLYKQVMRRWTNLCVGFNSWLQAVISGSCRMITLVIKLLMSYLSHLCLMFFDKETVTLGCLLTKQTEKVTIYGVNPTKRLQPSRIESSKGRQWGQVIYGTSAIFCEVHASQT